MKKLFSNFTLFEYILWISSLILITVVSLICKIDNYLNIITSIIGATSLIFISKGNVFGNFLSAFFGIFYAIVAISFRYYSEVVTYFCLYVPLSISSIITWLKNPYKNNINEVTVNHIKIKEIICASFASIIITIIFYFILKVLNTNNLIISTISIFTSFVAGYLQLRRSEYYAIAYCFNDIVLIILWILATITNLNYISMVVCFVVFLANDIYGFINWKKIKHKQAKNL